MLQILPRLEASRQRAAVEQIAAEVDPWQLLAVHKPLQQCFGVVDGKACTLQQKN